MQKSIKNRIYKISLFGCNFIFARTPCNFHDQQKWDKNCGCCGLILTFYSDEFIPPNHLKLIEKTMKVKDLIG